MEQITSPEQAQIHKAKQFIAENSPEPEQFAEYQQDRIDRLHNGERVWIVRNVDQSGRVYDLLDGSKHATVASILYDAGTRDAGIYECLVYGQSEDQELFADKMQEVRQWANSRGLTWQESEELFLGIALEEIEKLTV